MYISPVADNHRIAYASGHGTTRARALQDALAQLIGTVDDVLFERSVLHIRYTYARRPGLHVCTVTLCEDGEEGA